MDTQTIVFQETSRQDIYKRLANCYGLPEKRILIDLKILSDQLSNLNSKAALYIHQMLTKLDQNDCFEQLRIEFTRLFIGPYSLPAPPYGSVYIEKERKIMGDSTMDVQKRYQYFGLSLSNCFKEVPDHISAELEFMFFLICNEIERIHSNLPEQAQEMLSHQKSFHNDHLNNWIPDFTSCVIEHTDIEFYRNLAKATRIFIAEDFEYLERVSLLATQDLRI